MTAGIGACSWRWWPAVSPGTRASGARKPRGLRRGLRAVRGAGRRRSCRPARTSPRAMSFATAEEKYKKAAAAFEGIERRYPSLPEGLRARYFGALARLELGRVATAETALEGHRGPPRSGRPGAGPRAPGPRRALPPQRASSTRRSRRYRQFAGDTTVPPAARLRAHEPRPTAQEDAQKLGRGPRVLRAPAARSSRPASTRRRPGAAPTSCGSVDELEPERPHEEAHRLDPGRGGGGGGDRRRGRGRPSRSCCAAARPTASWSGELRQLPRPDLAGEMPEQPPAPSSASLFESTPALARGPSSRAWTARRHGPEIKARAAARELLVRRGLGQGAGAARRHRALPQSGKPAYAHLEFCGNREYYLATACTKIYAVPTAHPRRLGPRRGGDLLQGHARQARGAGAVRGRRQVQERAQPVHRDGLHRAAPRADGGAARQPLRAVRRGDREEPRARPKRRSGPSSTAGPTTASAAPRRPGSWTSFSTSDELEGRAEGRRAASPPGRYVQGVARLAASTAGRSSPSSTRWATSSPGESQSGLGGDVRGLRHDRPGAPRRRARTTSVRAIVLRVDSPGGSGTASDVIWREVQPRQEGEAGGRVHGRRGGLRRLLRGDGRRRDRRGARHDHGLDRRLRGQVQPARASTTSSASARRSVTRGKNAALFSSYRPWTDEERADVPQAHDRRSTTSS